MRRGDFVQRASTPGPLPLRPPAGFNGPLPVTVPAYDYAGEVGSATTVVHSGHRRATGTLISPEPNTVVHGAIIDVTITTLDTDPAYVRPLQYAAAFPA